MNDKNKPRISSQILRTSDRFLQSRLLTAAVYAALPIGMLNASMAQANSLFWDGGNAPTPPADGGSGNWDNGITQNWATDAAGDGYVAWNNANGDTAVFDITAGTVNVDQSSNVSADSLIFNVNGYTVGGTGSITLVGSGNLNVASLSASTTATINNAIAGTVGLTKSGIGVAVLGGTNTYTGATVINAGTLQVNSPGGLGTGNALTLNGGALNIGTNTQSIGNLTLSGAAILGTSVINVGGTLTANGTSNVGTYTVSPSANVVGPSLSFAAAASVSVAASSTLTINSAISATSLTKTGAGTLFLGGGGTNSYSTVTVNSGVLHIIFDRNLGAVPATPTDSVFLNGGSIYVDSSVWINATPNVNRNWVMGANGGTLDVNLSSGVPTLSFGISGVGQFTKTGKTTVQVSGTNSFAGGLVVLDGRYNVYNSNAAGTGSITLSGLSGASASFGIGGTTAISVTLSNPISVSNANGGTSVFDVNTSTSLQLNGAITGTGGFTKGLTSGTNGTLTLGNTSNSYSGDTIVTSGTLALGANEVIPDSSNVRIDTAVFDVGGKTETIGGLYSTVSTGTANLDGGNLNVGASNGSLVFGGKIIGTGTLTKVGTGTQVISGSATYVGLTAVQSGTLQLNSATAQAEITTGSGGDIRGGRMVFNYGTSADNTIPATVKPLLAASFNNNGFKNSSQIHSSTADARHGLGYIDDSTNKVLTVAYTYYGDANLDGVVNTSDFMALANNFGSTGATWQTGDFNYDGVVNALDFNYIATNFGATPITAPALGTLVPEPTMIGLLGMSALVATRRRRKM